ncbi:uncharacterized protein An08g10540 [Aspergillus niger]|uniref:Contig An08c0280, genomic contig n=2 Tax=Aspergillus niger TaxID=5061 RepID=A2QSF5_ASPNC|nr:uncharacterized protein An08g10540 [Aspergillus niger]CAK45727.1 unnamed protein product [Aspergillus niger]
MALPGQRKVAFGFEKASLFKRIIEASTSMNLKFYDRFYAPNLLAYYFTWIATGRCFPEQRAGTWQRHKLRDTGEMAVRKRPKALTEPSQSRGLPMGIPRPAAKTHPISTNNEQHVSGNSSFAHKGGNFGDKRPALAPPKLLVSFRISVVKHFATLTSKSIRQFCFWAAVYQNGSCQENQDEAQDQVRADIASARHLELYKATKDEEDLPGLGKHYCVECSKWFESEHNKVAHTKGKNHKRRLRILREEAHTQKAAEAAVGLGTDNGVRSQETTEMVIMED